ncbi:MAG TPA: hypothetical protein VGH19_15720 [Verrucomicrobiae bacterium]
MFLSQKHKLLLGVVALLLLAFIGIKRSQSRPAYIAIDIRFQSITTNSAGVRLAQFDVQNNSSFPIERAWFSEIQIQTPTGWRTLTNIHQSHPVPGPAVLPGESEVTDVPVPTTASPWRVSFVYFEHERQFGALLRSLKNSLRQFGLPVENGTRAYAFSSDAVTP